MFRAHVLKVMIASPGDVQDERALVTAAIHRWNDANSTARRIVLLPVKWETHSTPQLGDSPQTIINKQILDDVDIVIGVFGTRIGTPTEEYVSGTVEEIKKHVAAKKTAKLYFSDVPVSLSKVDSGQYASVQRFREECQRLGLYASYNTLDEFKSIVSHHLDLELNKPEFHWLAALAPVTDVDYTLSADALRLLKAVADDDGEVPFQEDFGLRIGDEDFTDGTARSVARWRAAFDELLNSGDIVHTSEALYKVTYQGYKTVDDAKSQNQSTTETTSPFDDLQREHIEESLGSLTYMQRDLLRFLLLKGGTVRGDVIARAFTDQTAPVDWNALTGPIKGKGLLTQIDDHINGYSIYAVNEQLATVLRGVLFPRTEGNDTAFLTGIPIPKRS